MPKVLVGKIGVDSGQVMIVDPCYFNDPLRWNIPKILEIAEEQKKKGDMRMYHNSQRIAREKTQLQNIVKDWKNFCEENFDKPKEYASGLISRTRNGDGEYPVYATFDKDGRVKKLEIVF